MRSINGATVGFWKRGRIKGKEKYRKRGQLLRGKVFVQERGAGENEQELLQGGQEIGGGGCQTGKSSTRSEGLKKEASPGQKTEKKRVAMTATAPGEASERAARKVLGFTWRPTEKEGRPRGGKKE